MRSGLGTGCEVGGLVWVTRVVARWWLCLCPRSSSPSKQAKHTRASCARTHIRHVPIRTTQGVRPPDPSGFVVHCAVRFWVGWGPGWFYRTRASSVFRCFPFVVSVGLEPLAYGRGNQGHNEDLHRLLTQHWVWLKELVCH